MSEPLRFFALTSPMPRPTASALSYQIRADLFTHLGAMEQAGLPPDKSFALLRLPRAAQGRVETTRALLARGNDPATAGLRAGLLTTLEHSLLRAAFQGGSPAATYRRLGAHYTTKAAQLARIKSRMALPLAMLTAALFIRPLPGLIGGQLGGGAYLVGVLAPLLALGLLGALALRVPSWFLSGAPWPGRAGIERALLALPLFGTMHRRRNGRDFIETLALLLEAGVPMFDALPTALGAVNNSLLRRDLAAILPAMKKGATLAQAFATLRLIETERLLSFTQTGEASGTLPEMLLRHAAFESEAINLFQEQLAEWLPKIFYACVAAWMVSNIVGGRPTLPPEID